MFSTGIYANASTKIITSNGYIKTGYDNNSVLLAGGGAKALSDFSMAHNHPYLPLAGGTMNSGAQIVVGSIAHSSGNIYNGGIQLRERGYATTSLDGKVYTDGPGITFHWGGRWVHMLNMHSNDIFWDNNKIWHAGNDGSGSGLDADLLDGTHKADLLTAASLGASGNSTTLSVTVGGTTKTGSVTVPYSLNSDKLDGIDSPDFMRRYSADGTVALNGNNFGYNAILGTINGYTYTGNNGKGLDNRSVILHFAGGKYTGHWNQIYINSGSIAFRTENHQDWWEILHSGNYTSYVNPRATSKTIWG